MLLDAKGRLWARLFAQEFLCEFVSTGDGLFDPAWLEWQEGRVKVAKGLSRWPELRKELLGLDGQGRKKNARDDLALGLALAVWGLTGKGAAAGDRADGRLL